MARNLLCGITGGIAAYKTPGIIRELTKRGITVKTVVTENALQFVTETTLRSLTGQPVYSKLFLESHDEFEHIELARWAHAALILPATANIIAKFANGIADDLLSTLFLTLKCPILLAPAMNEDMYLDPMTQRNLAALALKGVMSVDPSQGALACGTTGIGHLADETAIIEATTALFSMREKLGGRKVLVTAGGTRERIDPVRFITNRSSGKMGFAVADAFRRQGADVTLVSGPTNLIPPSAINFVPVESAQDMFDAVTRLSPKMHAIVKAAAVSDYTPVNIAADKIKKSDAGMTIKLKRTPDILAWLGAHRKKGQVLVGFSAETRDHLGNAASKLFGKKVDMVVLNDVAAADSGFDVDTNRVTFLYAPAVVKKVATATAHDLKGAKIALEELPLMSKPAVAEEIVRRVAMLLK
jgi:phosphopantothenoylcysteine decarboxylase / phosphopantothenate---cysteine ligase